MHPVVVFVERMTGCWVMAPNGYGIRAIFHFPVAIEIID